MCRCKYPKSVKKKNIDIMEDKKGDRCYKITFTLGKVGSSILIISRAPKKLETESCNSEYKRILKYIEDKKEDFKGIAKVTIVNLFTLYECSRVDLFENYLLNGKEYVEGNDEELCNDNILRESIKEADYIFGAWGEVVEGLNDIYSNRVELVLKMIREEMLASKDKKYAFKVGDLSKKGYPRHCLAWSYKDEIESLFE